MKKVFEQILTWFEDTFRDDKTEDWYHKKIVDSVVAPYTTKAKLKEELSDIITSLQQEQPNNMIQWTGKNLKEVIDFTGKSPRFGEWFKSWEDFENYVHSHDDILKLFCEDGSHYEVPVGAWIVKTPDGYFVPSVARFIHAKHEQPEVDLEVRKQIEELANDWHHKGFASDEDCPLCMQDLIDVLWYFYELGKVLNARKEETK